MSTHIRPLGGLRLTPTAAAPKDLTLVTVIGGMSLDLSRTELVPVTRITKVSVIGGVDLAVPKGTSVLVRGFSLLGGSGVAPADHTVIVRNWGLLGGVRVTER